MVFKNRTLREIADMICGNFKAEESFFRYRTSRDLTEFFQDCDTDYEHDGSTRNQWVIETLRDILAGSQSRLIAPPETFSRVIHVLMDQEDAVNEGAGRESAGAPQLCASS